MSKQEPSQFPLPGTVEKKSMGEGHYYVQSLTEHVFVVRRCLSIDGKPGSDDRIIRSFDIRHDAYSYTNSMNGEQHVE